jgi:ribonuclease HI
MEDNLEFDTNNGEELLALIIGIQTTIQRKCLWIVVEGDSQIIVIMLSELLNGATLGKVSPSWRLLNNL